MLFIAFFLGVVGLGPRMLNVDGDLGRHLTIGEYILDARSIPTRDIFSHTLRGQPLTPHEWLAQALFALSQRLAGLDGVVLLCALILAGAFTLVYRQSLRRSGALFPALAMAGWAAAAASLHWLARPHLWTMLFVALWAAGLERVRAGETRRWWALPLLILPWANLHGAFIAAFVIWALYLAGCMLDLRAGKAAGGEPSGEQRASGAVRPLLVIGPVSLLLTLVNPVGWRLWETSLGFLRSRYLVGHTAEYLPPNFHSPSTWPFLGMVVLSVLLLSAARTRLPAAWSLNLAVWTGLGLHSARNIPLYAILAAPILAHLAADAMRSMAALAGVRRLQGRLQATERALLGALWPAAAVIGVGAALMSGVSLAFGGEGNRFSPDVFPVEAVNWLQAHPPEGKMFNYFPWGGYLLYRMWPEQSVFIDGQTDFYGEALTRQYERAITAGEGWGEILGRYQVTWALLPPDTPLAQTMDAEPAWKAVYRDRTAVAFEREP